MIQNRYASFFFVLFVLFSYGQAIKNETLQNIPLDELEQKSRDICLPREEQAAYLDALIKKAKQNGDNLRLADAYHYLCSDFHAYTEKAVVYADSLIDLTKHWTHKTYPAHAYLQKGIQLYFLKQYYESFDSFLIADSFFKRQRDTLGQLRINHFVGILKTETNQSKEALAIFKENILFFNKESHKISYRNQYLKSLYALAYTYIKLNLPYSAEIISRRGIKESHKIDNKWYAYFLWSYGKSKQLKNEYDLAVDSLLKSVDMLKDKRLSQQSLCVNYLVLSDVYLSQGDTLSSIRYLEKINSIYQKEPQVIAEAEEAYSKLYHIYKLKGDEKKQIQLIDQLLEVKNNLKKIRHTDLGKGLSKIYKTSLILSEKENVIAELEKQSNHYILWIWSLAVFCIVLVIGCFFYLRWINKIHIQRFDALIQKDISAPRSETKANGKRKKKVELSEKLIREILSKLERFEKEKGYLHQNLSVSSLAKKLKTNTNYLSNIINIYKEKNFPQYVNDLRIDYAVRQLKTDDNTLIKYSIKALTKEFGFNTEGSFRSAFEKKTGICPSYFLQQFEKKSDKEEAP